MNKFFLLSVVVLLAWCGISHAAESHGWNDNIDWVPIAEAEAVSKSTGKPMMYVIHKSWCGACKRLKPLFAASKDIEDFSKEFVMVNVHDDDEPKDAKFAPDGGYIPRIIFRASDGTVLKDVNSGKDKYKYFYSDAASIHQVMKTALTAAKNTGKEEL